MHNLNKGRYMNRIFLKEVEEKTTYSIIEKNKICVTGLSKGAGTTFVATLLARYFSLQKQAVAYLELEAPTNDRPLLYDSVDMEQRFNKKIFHSFHESVQKGEKIRGKKNIDENINWGIVAPSFRDNLIPLTKEEEIRLLSNISGNTVIATCDNTSCFSEFDCIVCVVDPLPSKLLASEARLKKLKKIELEYDNILWVINKFNKGVSLKDIKKLIKAKDVFCIDKIDDAHIYTNEFQCKFHYRNKQVKDITDKSVSKIAANIASITKNTQS